MSRIELEKVLIKFASELVDTPQALIVISEEKNDKILLLLSTSSKHELGQLIGEKGVIANSLRTLLRAVSRRLQTKQVTLAVSPEIETLI